MFKTRLLSGIVLILVLLLILLPGGVVTLAAWCAVAVIGMSEFYKLADMAYTLPACAGYLGAIVYFILLGTIGAKCILPVAAFLLLILLGFYVFAFPKYKAMQIVMLYFGFFYVAVLLSFIVRTRMLESGGVLVWLIMITAWGCDTAAYCTGMLIGKHKLAPVLSPKKSVEGAVGGLVGAALLGFLYALIMNKTGSVPASCMWKYPVICLAGAVISQIGDLAASGFKRDHDIKDYGSLIPGHGGILDRFDSVIFTAPVIFYLAGIL